MRCLLFLVVGSAGWLFLGAAPALADNGPHVSGASVVTDSCAGCHRAHTGKAAKLLVQSQPALCYTCHGTGNTGAATDVQAGVGYSSIARATPAAALRGGGFSYALINSAAPTGQTTTGSNSGGAVPALAVGTVAAVTSTHSVDGTSVTAWGIGAIGSGAGATVQLTCGSCHDPHGNGNYRILKAIPEQSGGTALNITDATTKVYTTGNYWKVDDTNAAGFIANVSAWCSKCHTRYLAGAGSGDTNSTDPIYTYRHRGNDTTQGGATCIQCHVAHGSNASVSGTYSNAVANPDGTAALGNSRLLRIDNRGTCQMCHKK